MSESKAPVKKFTVYRRRPDLLRLELADAGVVLNFVRPNTAQSLTLSQGMFELRRTLDPKQGINAASYSATVLGLGPLVHSVEGLADEDGVDLSWSDLSEPEREDFLLNLPVGDVMGLFSDLILSGRLSPAEKKPSEGTSQTSTAADPADAPAAQGS